jgi:heat shock protein HslJ
MRLTWVIVCAALLAAGCSAEQPTPTLDGTSWRLVSIESMDSQQGSTQVPDPGKYTVSFGTDGRAAFTIDCNTGSGSFQSEPASGEGEPSGSLTFGPLATTLMGCPDSDGIDQKLSAALPFVRSYLLKEQALHMSMLADGGILHWEPK